VTRTLAFFCAWVLVLGCSAGYKDDAGGSGGTPAGLGGAHGALDAAVANTGSGGSGGSGTPDADGDPGTGGMEAPMFYDGGMVDPGTGGTPATSGCTITLGGVAHGTATCTMLGPTYDAKKDVSKIGFIGIKGAGSNLHSDNFSLDVRLKGMTMAKTYAGADITLGSGHLDVDDVMGGAIDFGADVTADPPMGTMSVTLAAGATHGTMDATLVDVDTGMMTATAHVVF
jgi:hypothetical protein